MTNDKNQSSWIIDSYYQLQPQIRKKKGRYPEKEFASNVCASTHITATEKGEVGVLHQK